MIKIVHYNVGGYLREHKILKALIYIYYKWYPLQYEASHYMIFNSNEINRQINILLHMKWMK